MSDFHGVYQNTLHIEVLDGVRCNTLHKFKLSDTMATRLEQGRVFNSHCELRCNSFQNTHIILAECLIFLALDIQHPKHVSLKHDWSCKLRGDVSNDFLIDVTGIPGNIRQIERFPMSPNPGQNAHLASGWQPPVVPICL